MIYLLDNNVISELWKPQPAPAVLHWISGAEWLLPVPVIAEIQYGAEAASSQARRLEINTRLDALLTDFPDTVLEWDSTTSRTWGRLQHSPESKRKPQALWDSLIDAMAVRYGLTVATRNVDDFRHARTFNPFSEHPPGQSAT